MLTYRWPIRTYSEQNCRDHWAKKARRAKSQRADAHLLFKACPLPAAITFTRLAPRALDDDNLVGAFKALRDGIADRLGVKDDDPRISWSYAQVTNPKDPSYAVQVTVEVRP